MKVFKSQHWHLLLLLLLLTGIYFYVGYDSSVLQGQLWGISTRAWLIIAILSPILHHLYVLICWRLELYYNSLTKAFGENGFQYYKIGFAILFASRLVTIILLAIANAETLNMNYVLACLITAIISVPAIYLFYSVRKYFGFDRAFGIDHFQPEIYKTRPFVRQGIFKYTSNGMYIFGFLVLWVPGLLLLSKAAIVLALFNHLYIWVHYFFTELPDIKVIYGD